MNNFKLVVVMVFGTFDILHPGHLNFFKQAKKLGNFLLIVVARDRYVKKAKSKYPMNNEKLRIKNVRKIKKTDKVILGSSTHNFYQTIRTHNAKIIALGYDQKPRIFELKRNLRRHRLGYIKVVRLRAFKPNLYKTSLLVK